MDWTPLIGRRRPAQPDAVRLATLVHQLGASPSGERSGGADGETRRVVAELAGEGRLLALDHLLRHPVTLAYLVIDRFRRRPELDEQRAAGVRRVRQLLDAERRQHRPAGRRSTWPSARADAHPPGAYPFEPLGWLRLDDALALLTCRDLLRVDAAGGELVYRLTGRGAELLEQRYYAADRRASVHVQLCAVIDELLPTEDGAALERRLARVERELVEFRRDEQLAPERDPLPELFFQTFHERP